VIKTKPLKSTSSEKFFDLHEVGTVTSVREFIVEVDGLPSCSYGQMVEFSNGDKGMVMGFSEKKVSILSFGGKGRIRRGFEVTSKGQGLEMGVGDGFLGRCVTGLGEPFDNEGLIAHDRYSSIFCEAPGVMERLPVNQALETGVRTIDSSFPIAKGQRQLIIGDQMTGKSSIAIDTILNQSNKGVICIYCAIGQSQASFLKLLRILKQRGAMSHSIVVAGIASAPLGEQFLAPYFASTLGEYFASQGKDVFIAFDDLGKHAWTYRQLSLLLQRSPGREAYPGDIFYVHSQLLERAGRFDSERGGGTMTFFPIVPTIQGDITGYIQTNLISITDGQLYLNTTLFQRGFRPAIDFGLSVSRIGNRAQCDAMKELSGKLRLEYLQYQELQSMRTMKTGFSEKPDLRLVRGQLVTELFTQTNGRSSSLAEQVIFLYALRQGLLDQKVDSWNYFKMNIYHWIQKKYPQLISDIEGKKKISGSLKKILHNTISEFLHGKIEEL
jgi:F-type H+/Na+-transporting ATPase subunit alpha